MNIEIRTDNHIANSERLIDYVRQELLNDFQRYNEKVTHFEVHLSDDHAERGDDDKRCMIEARPAGLKPVAVTHKAANIDQAIHGAIDKLKRSLEHTYAKQDHGTHHGRGTKVEWVEQVE